MIEKLGQSQPSSQPFSGDRIMKERLAVKQARRLEDLNKLEAGESRIAMQAKNAAFKPGSDVHIERPKRQRS